MRVIVNDFYNSYQDNTGGKVSKKTYTKFIRLMFKAMFELMFTHKFHLTLPNSGGDLFIAPWKFRGGLVPPDGKYFQLKWAHTKDSTLLNRKIMTFQTSDRTTRHKRTFLWKMREGNMTMMEPYPYPLREFIEL